MQAHVLHARCVFVAATHIDAVRYSPAYAALAPASRAEIRENRRRMTPEDSCALL